MEKVPSWGRGRVHGKTHGSHPENIEFRLRMWVVTSNAQ